MSVNGLQTPYSGMYVNNFRQDVTANNIANINTDGFKASEVQTADRAYINDIGTGTRVTGTYAPNRPGPVAMDTAGVSATGMVEQSNTDLVRERVNQMAAQQAYNANIPMVRAVDEMTQSILDIKR